MGSEYFQTRLAYDLRREVLWRVLYRYYFSLLIADTDCVLELGAGYGHFINQVRTKKAIAVDSWEGFTDYLQAAFPAANGQVATTGFAIPHSPLFAFALETPWRADVRSSSSKMTE
jgi:hypothetical protein